MQIYPPGAEFAQNNFVPGSQPVSLARSDIQTLPLPLHPFLHRPRVFPHRQTPQAAQAGQYPHRSLPVRLIIQRPGQAGPHNGRESQRSVEERVDLRESALDAEERGVPRAQFLGFEEDVGGEGGEYEVETET